MSTLVGKHCRLYITRSLSSKFISEESKKAFDSIASAIPDREYMLTSAVDTEMCAFRLKQNHIVFSARDYYRVPSSNLVFMSVRDIFSLRFKFYTVMRFYYGHTVLFEFRPVRTADYNERVVAPL